MSLDVESIVDGVVTLSEIRPIWTIDRQDKSLKSHPLNSAAVGKFQSNRLNVTTPLQQYPKDTPKIIAFESVYSMDGHIAPIAASN